MRNILLGAAGGAALFSAATATPAAAMPFDPGAMRPAVDAVNPVEKAACWRYGWHGWGWYPCHGYWHWRW